MSRWEPAGAPSAALAGERRGAAAWLRLNRPETLNCLSPQMLAEFDIALWAIEQDRTLRCVVLTAAGRAFSVGGDLKALQEFAGAPDPAAAASAYSDSISRLLARLEALPIPVIAAIDGMALAGGLEIALCCDLVVASERAVFGDAHANYGLLPGAGGSVRLPRKIGPNRAKYLMYTGATVPASLMRDWGLVHSVVAPERLEHEVQALTDSLSGKSPLGLARMKHLVDNGLDLPLDQALRAEQAVVLAHNSSHDRNEGLAAFAARREPVFNGS
ncbi:enoyl-CoA hydratase/isomerase family protein [Variovorax defluvii]|uniref:Enoyl-CoA hydratase/isomerase family protein n=1 Tax=Variovorax defluvii TaxID=913761 RepID=A0ABP8HF69_9BURK